MSIINICTLYLHSEKELIPKEDIILKNKIIGIRLITPSLKSLNIDVLSVNMSLEIKIITDNNSIDYQNTRLSDTCHAVCQPYLIAQAGPKDKVIKGLLQVSLDYGFHQIIINKTIHVAGQFY